MIKVVTPKEMALAESHAYADGCSEEAFMENAGCGIAEHVHEYIQLNDEERVFCFAAKGTIWAMLMWEGAHSLHHGYRVPLAFQVTAIEESSPLCKKNYNRFIENGGNLETTFPTSGVILTAFSEPGFTAPQRALCLRCFSGKPNETADPCHRHPFGVEWRNGGRFQALRFRRRRPFI